MHPHSRWDDFCALLMHMLRVEKGYCFHNFPVQFYKCPLQLAVSNNYPLSTRNFRLSWLLLPNEIPKNYPKILNSKNSRNARVDFLSVRCRQPKCRAERLGRVLVVVDYRMSLRIYFFLQIVFYLNFCPITTFKSPTILFKTNFDWLLRNWESKLQVRFQ